MIATQQALGHKSIATSLVCQCMVQDPIRARVQRATSELARIAETKAKADETEVAPPLARDHLIDINPTR